MPGSSQIPEPLRPDPDHSVATKTLSPYRKWTPAMRISAALVLLSFLCLLAGGIVTGVTHDFSVRGVENTILAWGGWGVGVSIGLMVVHTFVPFPAELLAFANGSIYGLLWGTVITWAGAMLGALVAFGLSRVLGRPFLVLVVAERKLRRIDDWATSCGAYAIFFSRFIPVVAFNLINYAAGLSRVSWWTFTWATAVGILPMVVLMVLMGHQAELITWQAGLLLAACAVLLTCLLHRSAAARRNPPSTGDTSPRNPSMPVR